MLSSGLRMCQGPCKKIMCQRMNMKWAATVFIKMCKVNGQPFWKTVLCTTMSRSGSLQHILGFFTCIMLSIKEKNPWNSYLLCTKPHHCCDLTSLTQKTSGTCTQMKWDFPQFIPVCFLLEPSWIRRPRPRATVLFWLIHQFTPVSTFLSAFPTSPLECTSLLWVFLLLIG